MINTYNGALGICKKEWKRYPWTGVVWFSNNNVKWKSKIQERIYIVNFEVKKRKEEVNKKHSHSLVSAGH